MLKCPPVARWPPEGKWMPTRGTKMILRDFYIFLLSCFLEENLHKVCQGPSAPGREGLHAQGAPHRAAQERGSVM